MFLNGLVLVTNLCWSAWGIFDKKALSSSRPRNVLLIQYLLALPEFVLIIAYILLTEHQLTLNPNAIFWAALGSATSTVAMIAYMVAMNRAEASYVLGITASYPLVMQVLATIFLGEHLVGNRLIGSALIALGVFAIGQSDHAVHPPADAQGEHVHDPATARDRRIITICVIFATIGWGIHGLFDKIAVGYAPPIVVMAARCGLDVITSGLLLLGSRFMKMELQLKRPETWKFCGFSSMCLWVGYICYLNAIKVSTASYVIVITGCYPLLMYIFALIFLREQLNKKRLAGVSFVVLGGIVVQFTQGG
ncbi:MAG TPA: DMT family transporter [Planktothrix sp.]